MSIMTGYERDAIIANNVFLFLSGRDEWEDILDWMSKHLKVRRLMCGTLVIAEGSWKHPGASYSESDYACVTFDGNSINFSRKDRQTKIEKSGIHLSTVGANMNPNAVLLKYKTSYTKAVA